MVKLVVFTSNMVYQPLSKNFCLCVKSKSMWTTTPVLGKGDSNKLLQK